MPISVIAPIDQALDRTRRIMFRPFQFVKWLKLGFCAFLAGIGESGGCDFSRGGQGHGLPTVSAGAHRLARMDVSELMAMGAGVLILAIAVITLLIWLQSRGRFMFLDGVIRNRGTVIEPWKRFRPLGNSLFGISLSFTLATLATILLVVGIGISIAWPDIQAERLGPRGVTGIVVGGSLFLLVAVTALSISLLLHDLVLPAMYLRNERIRTAWATVRRELLPGNLGPIVLFFVMKVILGITMALIAATVTCATFCVAAMPYVGTVILLPLTVFWQSYTLHFLEQFGPNWKFFAYDGVLHCSGCGSDLTGSDSNFCKGCGAPVPRNR